MSDSEKKATRKHGKHLRVPVLPEEEATIKANAQASGLPVADYLRRLGLGHEVRGVIDQQRVLDLAKINADQGRLGGLLKMWLANDERLTKFSKPWTQATIKALLARLEQTQAAMLELVRKL